MLLQENAFAGNIIGKLDAGNNSLSGTVKLEGGELSNATVSSVTLVSGASTTYTLRNVSLSGLTTDEDGIRLEMRNVHLKSNVTIADDLTISLTAATDLTAAGASKTITVSANKTLSFVSSIPALTFDVEAEGTAEVFTLQPTGVAQP